MVEILTGFVAIVAVQLVWWYWGYPIFVCVLARNIDIKVTIVVVIPS